MKKLIILLAVIVIGIGVFYTTADFIAKRALEKIVSDTLQVDVSIGNVDLSIAEGKARFEKITIGNPDPYKSDFSFSVAYIDVTLDPSTVTEQTILVNEVTVFEPIVFYEMTGQGNNIRKLQQNAAASSSSSASSSDGNKKDVIIQNLYIRAGKLVTPVNQAQILMPDIHLKQIGSNNKAASFEKVMNMVLKTMGKNITNIDPKALGGNIKKGLTGAGEGMLEGLKGMGGAILGK